MSSKFSSFSLVVALLGCQNEDQCSKSRAYLAPFRASKVDLNAMTLGSQRANVLYDLDCIRKSDSDVSRLIPNSILNSSLEVYSVEEEIQNSLTKSEDDCVLGISEFKTFNLGAPTEVPLGDPRAQDHLRAIKSDSISELELSFGEGREVRVAIVDTGTDLDHEDLKDHAWVNTGEVPNNQIDDDNNGYVDDINGYNFASQTGRSGPNGGFFGVDHGTHVAGLAAAIQDNGKGGRGVRGKNIKIMSLNVFGQSGSARLTNIENAIRYAADNGAHIINMSLGAIGRSASMESAMLYALQKGATIVVAAGNESQELSDSFFVTPASYAKSHQGIIAVGSLDSGTGRISQFSNFSSTYVELLAPGSEDSVGRVGLLSTLIGQNYGRMEGTSMASPVAAGALALLYAYLPVEQLVPQRIESLFLSVSRRESSLSNRVLNGGVLDLSSLVRGLEAALTDGEVGEEPIEEDRDPLNDSNPKDPEPICK